MGDLDLVASELADSSSEAGGAPLVLLFLPVNDRPEHSGIKNRSGL